MVLSMILLPAVCLRSETWSRTATGMHACLDYIGNPRSLMVEWLRLPGDLVFIIFGSMPLVIAAIKGWLGGRVSGTRT